jgi:hypothetical protein
MVNEACGPGRELARSPGRRPLAIAARLAMQVQLNLGRLGDCLVCAAHSVMTRMAWNAAL